MQTPQGLPCLPEVIASPVVDGMNAWLVSKIDFGLIARQYRHRYGVDVYAHLESPVPKVGGLYRCSATGYEFFYPQRLAGLSSLYEEMQMFPWYYEPWKWEHELARALLQDGGRVLEVGCGVGFFLKRISEDLNVACTGLESNARARDTGIFDNIVCESIQDHAVHNPNRFSMICAFQVLEHVYEVEAFLAACCAALAPNGLLFISVPNNDSNIQYDKRNVLNMPPHHMGLWRAGSLASLVNHFPLTLEGIYSEPLGEASIQWHTILRYSKSIGYLPALVLDKVRFFRARKRFDLETARRREITPDHTIACIYRKTGQQHRMHSGLLQVRQYQGFPSTVHQGDPLPSIRQFPVDGLGP